MLLYRITHKAFSKKLLAPGFAGRWNSTGRKVIYCAESIALAFMENMVRRQGVGFNADFKTMIIEIPDNEKITTISPDQLPSGWRSFTNYSKCQPIGNIWYDNAKTLLLKVPSAVLPEANNYVINSQHPHFNLVKIHKITTLIPDERIENLLKKK